MLVINSGMPPTSVPITGTLRKNASLTTVVGKAFHSGWHYNYTVEDLIITCMASSQERSVQYTTFPLISDSASFKISIPFSLTVSANKCNLIWNFFNVFNFFKHFSI